MLRWRSDEDELYEGVPEHLHHELVTWASPFLDDDQDRRAIIRNLRLPTAPNYLRGHLWDMAKDRGDEYLRVLAFMLERLADAEYAADLEVALREGGSAWRVADLPGSDGFGLERRVDPTAQAQFDAAVEEDDSASDHLRRAWHAAFGLTPDGDKAYREAVRAAEVALNPVVAPDDRDFTLGKGIRCMRDGASKFELDPSSRKATPGIERFVGMCELLWHGQARHGEQDSVARNSLEEGIAATHLAVAIVSLVRCGAFRRAGSPDAP